MARSRSTSKSKTANAKSIHSNNSQVGHFRTNVAAFVAAFAGAVVAVPVTLAVALPAIHSDVTSATAGLTSRSVQVRPADATTTLTPDQIAAVCGQPSSVQAGVTPAGQVLGASMVSQPSLPVGGGGGSSGGGSTTTFVKKLVNGVFTTTASINNTGPKSNNVITTNNTATTTVTNTNDLDVNVSNDQSASSGDATTKDNTTAGSSTTGTASNQNQTDLNLSVNN